MSIPILRGRNFQPGERGVIIVGESLAKKLWPGQDPLGKLAPNEKTVIGIAGTARTVAMQDDSATELYVPLNAQSELLPTAVVLLKTAAPPETLAGQLRSIALGVDSRVVPAVTLLSESFDHRIREGRDLALVISGLGLLATLLSAVGVFGMAAYAVSQRQKEIGIRMALGAAAANVLALVLRQFTVPLAVGLTAGIALAAGISVALRSLLYGLSHLDPVSYVAAILVFSVLTAIAAAIPARRALRVDPAVVLRHE